MQPNRANDPITTSARVNPAPTPSPSPTPTAPRRRAQRGINGWFILLITFLPILVLGCMVVSVGWYAQDWGAMIMGQTVLAESRPSPVAEVARALRVDNVADVRTLQPDEQGFLNVTARLVNDSDVALAGASVKAEVFHTGANGEREGVGSGIATVLNIPARGSVDFTIPVHLSDPPIPRDEIGPAEGEVEYDAVELYVDHAWGNTSAAEN